MEEVVYVFVQSVYILLSAIQLLMLARAITSWIPMDEESKLGMFLYMATEPLIAPVRTLLDRIPAVRNMPIDIAFMATVVLISVVQLLLPTVYLW